LGQIREQSSSQCFRLRLPSPRNWTTDGFCDDRAASSVPKSASAEMTIRPSAAWLEDHVVVGVQTDRTNVYRIVTGLLQKSG
jgi:hypothetical protein